MSFYRMRVIALIQTFVQSKHSVSQFQPRICLTPTQIWRLDKNIKKHYVRFNSFIYENNWYVIYLCPFLSFAHLWHIGYSRTDFYWINTNIRLDVVFKSVQFYFSSSFAKFHFHTSAWRESLTQVHINFRCSFWRSYLNFSASYFIRDPKVRCCTFWFTDADTNQYAVEIIILIREKLNW